MFAHDDDVAHAVDDAGVHQHEPISLKSMLDSVRSSIIAATFRVNDWPNAKPNWMRPPAMDRATVFRARR